ncbi:MAG: hypothetical protein FWB72_07005 [Firmicutes bacterium]|nr:hypothetical protein [Bacillota bacterium]MCL2177667.1 hypothetical protein [Bacillota bacterium]
MIKIQSAEQLEALRKIIEDAEESRAEADRDGWLTIDELGDMLEIKISEKYRAVKA